jgi:SAM-dependent methyltransferase
MAHPAPQPLMYTDLADWFHLVTAPADYAEEADFYLRTLVEAAGGRRIGTLLELGSGGGNNAFHYKRRVSEVVLSDLADGMLALSRQLHPELEHVRGDMRTVRLGRTFDAVFVHDAISYLTTETDLRQALETVFVHLRPGGVALFAPDHVQEKFSAGTDCGGHDGDDGRGLRYLEWTSPPEPGESSYVVDYAYLLHAVGQPVRTVYDRHICGLFPEATWLRLLQEVGFQARGLPFEHSEEPPGSLEVFVGVRPDT